MIHEKRGLLEIQGAIICAIGRQVRHFGKGLTRFTNDAGRDLDGIRAAAGKVPALKHGQPGRD